jgi:hypothetical protein
MEIEEHSNLVFTSVLTDWYEMSFAQATTMYKRFSVLSKLFIFLILHAVSRPNEQMSGVHVSS